MSETTDIGWADSTISPWFICTEQSPDCLNCYARELTEQKFAFVSKDGDPIKSGVIRRAYFRVGFADWATRPVWGNRATRVLSKGFWTEAVRLNKKPWICEACGRADDRRYDHSCTGDPKDAQHTSNLKWHRRRVFQSLMDWLDDFPAGVIDQEGNRLTAVAVLARLLDLIRITPNIDWLLLTKRIEDFYDKMECVLVSTTGDLQAWVQHWMDGQQSPRHVWLGVSVGDQKRAEERIPKLLQTPAAIRFLSVEPLLEKVNLTIGHDYRKHDTLKGTETYFNSDGASKVSVTPKVDWVIVGGESGKNRRDCGVAAIESVVQQCVAAGVPCYTKQDCALLPGQKGRLSDNAWSFKEFPLSHALTVSVAIGTKV